MSGMRASIGAMGRVGALPAVDDGCRDRGPIRLTDNDYPIVDLP